MHPLVKEHLEKIIFFFDDGYDGPEYRKYNELSNDSCSIEEYSKLYDKVDLYGKYVLSIEVVEWFNSTDMEMLIYLNINNPQFINIITVVKLLSIEKDRSKNTSLAISLLEVILRDTIRKDVIDGILS